MHVQLFEDNFEVIVLTNCDLVDGIHHAANNLHDIFYENKTGNVTLPEVDKGLRNNIYDIYA